MVALLMFAGLRASELRGLRAADVDLDAAEVRVSQRADKWQVVRPVKSAAGRRRIPIPPMTVGVLRHWVIKCPANDLGLLFPSSTGTPVSYANLYNRVWVPLLDDAGLTIRTTVPEKPGQVRTTPRFGMHALRHVACSLWIAQAATPKQVQTWAGHESIQFTMDRYGHLWADQAADQAITGAAECSILG